MIVYVTNNKKEKNLEPLNLEPENENKVRNMDCEIIVRSATHNTLDACLLLHFNYYATKHLEHPDFWCWF